MANFKVYLAVVFIGLFFICRCSNSNDKTLTTSRDITLQPTKKLEIPIDKTVAIYSATVDVIEEGGKEYIFKTNHNELLFLDIAQRKLFKRILFPKEGPDGVGSIAQAYYHNKDSIFLLTNPYTFILVNSDRKIINKYKLTADTEAGSRGVYGQNNNKLMYHDGEIIAFMHPIIHPNGKTMQLKSNAIMALDCKTTKTESLPFLFPNRLQNPNETWHFIHFRPTTLIHNDNLVLSFPAIDSLYVYSFKSKTMKLFGGSGKYSSKSNKPLAAVSEAASKEAYKSCHAFFLIKYDKYRDIYYRFVLCPTDEKTNNYSLENMTLMKPFAIQIFNRKFELIGETDIFKAKEYNFVDSFVSKDGLYISNNHPDNLKMNENFLSYTLFSIAKL
jgi:hypothetical protein